MSTNHIFNIHINKLDLALSNLQWLTGHKTKLNQTKPNQIKPKLFLPNFISSESSPFS